jgi:hypothetical protein
MGPCTTRFQSCIPDTSVATETGLRPTVSMPHNIVPLQEASAGDFLQRDCAAAQPTTPLAGFAAMDADEQRPAMLPCRAGEDQPLRREHSTKPMRLTLTSAAGWETASPAGLERERPSLAASWSCAQRTLPPRPGQDQRCALPTNGRLPGYKNHATQHSTT